MPRSNRNRTKNYTLQTTYLHISQYAPVYGGLPSFLTEVPERDSEVIFAMEDATSALSHADSLCPLLPLLSSSLPFYGSIIL